MIPLPFLPADPATVLVMLIAALSVDAVLGEMPWLTRFVPHPVVLIGRFTGWLDRHLNRPQRSPADRRARGILTVLLVVLSAAAAGGAVAWLARRHPVAGTIELVALALLVAQRSLYDHVAAVAGGLETGGLAAGRAAVGRIVGRDPRSLDTAGVARAAVESTAENFADGVVAPVFWGVLFGLPGVAAYKAVNTLDSMIGHRSEHYRDFGWAAARLDDAANWVPARLAALMIAAAAALRGIGRPIEALHVMLRDARKHRSVNAGWPEAAMAGVLRLSLAGPRHYDGYVVDDPWIGNGTPEAGASDIRRALSVLVGACIVDVAALAVLLFLVRGS